ncbi:DUF3667 domain-containing protein [Novosphingobium sp.]|uniref:DUF3667 domain-containing protein n=1 Tax=Novosphingobium sp. TaxID=1874826 RepID=UPI00286D8858|nr:DUF3667 domain-containing protein [Novosphingobium sp.]
MSGIDAIGDVVDGALIARAVEPDHGEAAGKADASLVDGHTHEAACLNCDTVLIGKHCHACGQAAHVHKTIGAFFHDLLHGVFHFEGKIWRTLPALAFRPGRMTREYIDGRRASYVSPIALFLFCVFLMFALVSNIGGSLGDGTNVDVNGSSIKGLEANKAAIKRLEAQRALLVKEGKPTEAIEGEIQGRKSGIAVMEELNNPLEETIAGGGEKTPTGKPRVYSDIPALNSILKHASENPKLALYKLQSNAYKFAWLLIPISVPLLWLLFPFSRRFGLYDHTVFVTYSLAFMMLLVSLLTAMSALWLGALAVGMTFIPPVHIYKHVRYTYALSRFGASWRTAALLIYAGIALTFFLMAIIAMGIE